MQLGTVRIPLTKDETSWIDVFQLPEELLPSKEEFEELWDLHPEEHAKVMMYGKLIPVPRFQQSYGKSYSFSGVKHEALPIPPILQKFLDYANYTSYSDTYSAKFNMVLVNWYRDGKDYIGPHSDDERELVTNSEGETVVFSISLGQKRVFRLLPKNPQNIEKEITMENGCCIVMGGTTQKTHKHSVPKMALSKASERRINITFRIFK